MYGFWFVAIFSMLPGLSSDSVTAEGFSHQEGEGERATERAAVSLISSTKDF